MAKKSNLQELMADASQKVADEMQQKSDKTPYDRAKIARREGRFEDANSILMFLLSLEPESVSIFGQLADNYRDMKDYSSAVSFYKSADDLRVLAGSRDIYFQDEYWACLAELKKNPGIETKFIN